jgi:hypothetical protein
MLIEKYAALKSFDHLKFRRGRSVFVGDHEDAERCKKLENTKIVLYAPSQWHDRFPDGYIQFGWGRGREGRKLFDLKRQVIHDTPAYIFENNKGIDLLYRHLKALNQLRNYVQTLQSGDLMACWELVVKRIEPESRPWGREDYLRCQILQFLPFLGLQYLESLVDAARPSADTAGL